MKRHIGVDLHKTNFTVCYLKDGEKQGIEAFGVNQEGLERFKKTLTKEDEVAVESTGNTYYFVREIEGLVACVKIINPVQFKVISSSVKKTDERDAEIIARYLSKGLIPEVRMRSKEESQIKSLIETREKFVKSRSSLKNKLHSILNANGIVSHREMFSSKKGLAKLEGVNIDCAYRFEIRLIVEQIESLNLAIEKIDEELTERGKKVPGHKNAVSITGIGNITATIILNAIGNVSYFADEKKFEAYLGLVPRVHASNETIQHGKITKNGNKMARTALVQAAFVAIRYNERLKKFYERLKEKKGSGKAIVATARKLAGIVYYTLKNNWVWEDFNAGLLAVTH